MTHPNQSESSEQTGSPNWVKVGDFEVATFVDGEHQQKSAEMILRVWERIGRPNCLYIRPAKKTIFPCGCNVCSAGSPEDCLNECPRNRKMGDKNG